MNCAHFAEKLFSDAVNMLNAVDCSVDTYIVCLDPYGKRRPEKAHTTASRKKEQARKVERGAPKHVPVPDGQSQYFLDDKPMPCDVNSIFSISEIKKQFYLFLSEYITKPVFRKRIPKGKRIILSGGMVRKQLSEQQSSPNSFTCDAPSSSSSSGSLKEQEVVNSCPIQVGCDSVLFLHKYESENEQVDVSEGDLDALVWVHRFPKKNVLVKSGDGDLLPIFLMQMRRVEGMNPDRVCWFVTRRSVGTTLHDKKYLDYKQYMSSSYKRCVKAGVDTEEAWKHCDGVTSTNVQKTKIVWGDIYFNISGLWTEIQLEYQDYMQDTRSSKKEQTKSVSRSKFDDELVLNENNMWHEISCPVEQFVLMMVVLTQKHDYIASGLFAPRVNVGHCFLAYYVHLTRIGSMVRAYHAKSNPNQMYYVINVHAIRRWAVACYHYRTCRNIKRGKRNESQFEAAKYKSFNNARVKQLPSIIVHQKLASQCLWVLDYYGNGCVPQTEIIDGTKPNINGQQVFGYTRSGWATSVVPGNIRSTIPKKYIMDNKKIIKYEKK
jgi:hypothetical protein